MMSRVRAGAEGVDGEGETEGLVMAGIAVRGENKVNAPS